MQLANLKDYEARRMEFELLTEEFINRGKKAQDDRKQAKLMEKLKINLFEGTFDSQGNY